MTGGFRWNKVGFVAQVGGGIFIVVREAIGELAALASDAGRGWRNLSAGVVGGCGKADYPVYCVKRMGLVLFPAVSVGDKQVRPNGAATPLRLFYGEKRAISQSQKCCQRGLVLPRRGRGVTSSAARRYGGARWFCKRPCFTARLE